MSRLSIVYLCFILSNGEQDVKDLYKTLNIEKENPTTAEIRKAYRRLSLKYHPDKNPGDQEAAEKFRKVQDAYDIVSDEDTRKIYEQFGSNEFHSQWAYQQAKYEGRIKGGKDSFYKNFDLIENIKGSRDFKNKTRSGAWLLKFYAPWCVHCQKSIPHLKKAAILLDGVARVGSINCERNKRLCNRMGIHSFPTIAYRDLANDIDLEHFDGNHNPEDFYSFVIQNKESALAELTRENFQETVIDSEDVWLVQFTGGQWCPPCMALKSTFRKTSYRLKEFVRFGSVDCDKHKAACVNEDIGYYPAYKLYARGKGRQGKVLESDSNQFGYPQATMLNLIAEVAPLMMPSVKNSDRDVIAQIFEKHDPDRMEEIDELLEIYDGETEELIKSLRTRYESIYEGDETCEENEKENCTNVEF